MTTISQKQDYKLEFNGVKTYFVTNGQDCVFVTESKIKANNFYKKMLQCAGL